VATATRRDGLVTITRIIVLSTFILLCVKVHKGEDTYVKDRERSDKVKKLVFLIFPFREI
jgi:hypothetical protein